MTGVLPEVGERVRAVRLAVGPSGIDDNKVIPPGTEGTVVSVNRLQIGVRWDNGSSLSLLPDEDEWEVIGR